MLNVDGVATGAEVNAGGSNSASKDELSADTKV
jgi:hypothetical protein